MNSRLYKSSFQPIRHLETAGMIPETVRTFEMLLKMAGGLVLNPFYHLAVEAKKQSSRTPPRVEAATGRPVAAHMFNESGSRRFKAPGKTTVDYSRPAIATTEPARHLPSKRRSHPGRSRPHSSGRVAAGNSRWWSGTKSTSGWRRRRNPKVEPSCHSLCRRR